MPHPMRAGRLLTYAMAIATLGLGLFVSTPVLAAHPHPALFALAPTAFPSGSTVVRAGVESNRRLQLDDHHHFGAPPGALGRVTGYYMDAVQGDPGSASRPYTSYLVSIFRSARQAETAYSIRWETWFVEEYSTSPPPAPITVGARGESALFHSLDPSNPHLSELLFRRGTILVEVFQDTGSAAPTDDVLQTFYSIATDLDGVARQHPRGV